MKKSLLCIVLALITIFATVPVAFAEETGTTLKDDDFAMKTFQALYANKTFAPDSDLKVDSGTYEKGILVSGKNNVLSTKKISLGNVNFGSEKLQRIQLAAVGEMGVKTKLMVYLDGSSSPVATFDVPTQEESGEWTLQKNQNVDVSSIGITGSHSISISFCQYFKSGKAKDDGTCKIFLKSIQFVKQTIPVINIDIDESLGSIDKMNNDPKHQTKCYGDITISVPSTFKSRYGNFTGGTYDLEFIKGRGNSTWMSAKKPYKIKLDKKADLFNMGANKNWALLANDYDNTLIRNRMTYGIGEDLGLPFTPQGIPVDVVMNGDYLGCYFLCENVRVDEQRVNIDNLEEDKSDITGGYLLGTAFYGADDGAYLFTTDNGVEWNVTSPDATTGDLSKENAYIEHYIQKIENALMRKKDPDTGKVENPFDFMDLDSAVSYYLIQEFSGNGDFFGTGSTYAYKVRGGKLYWGPLWDFDIAYAYGDDTDFFGNFWVNQKSWFQLMASFPEFQEATKTYWKEKLEPELREISKDGGTIDQYAEELKYSAANNACYAKTSYGSVMFEDTGIDTSSTAVAMAGYTENCKVLKKNIKERIDWISANIDSIGIPNMTIKFKANGKVVDTATVYAGCRLSSYPKNPVSTDKNKVFAGWYYTYKDEYGYTQSVYIYNGELYLVTLARDGVKSITANAKFVDKSQDTTVTKVYFEKSKYRFPIDKSANASYCIPFAKIPVDGDVDTVTWSVSDNSIADITANHSFVFIEPKAAGTTKITATTKAGKKYSVTVEIVEGINKANYFEYIPYYFSINKSKMTLTPGSVGKFSVANIRPAEYLDIENASGMAYEWFTSDAQVANPKSGLVYANGVGTAIIVLKNTNLETLKFATVTVNPKKAVISKATKSGTKMTVKMKSKVSKTYGDKYQIYYKVKGAKEWQKASTTKQSTSITVTAGKTYQVKARAIKKVDEKTYYGSWSKVKTVK